MPTPKYGSRDHEAAFLSALIGKKIVLRLVGGEGMTATLRDVFNECLLVEDDGNHILVYRRAIVTVQQAYLDKQSES